MNMNIFRALLAICYLFGTSACDAQLVPKATFHGEQSNPVKLIPDLELRAKAKKISVDTIHHISFEFAELYMPGKPLIIDDRKLIKQIVFALKQAETWDRDPGLSGLTVTKDLGDSFQIHYKTRAKANEEGTDSSYKNIFYFQAANLGLSFGRKFNEALKAIGRFKALEAQAIVAKITNDVDRIELGSLKRYSSRSDVTKILSALKHADGRLFDYVSGPVPCTTKLVLRSGSSRTLYLALDYQNYRKVGRKVLPFPFREYLVSAYYEGRDPVKDHM